MANLYSVPLKNSVQHTLAGTLTQAETSTITLDSSVVLELQATSSMKGLLVIDRVDVNGALTPTKTEYIAYTGVSGSTVTGLTRAVAGTTAQGHAIGAVVEFVPDVTWAQAINDVFTTQHNSDGTHKTLSQISLVSTTLLNSVSFGLSSASGVLTNPMLFNASIASSTITGSTIDSFTFKSALSNATQGDLLTYNNNIIDRLSVGTLNQVLSVNSTVSGLVPQYINRIQFYKARISTTNVTTTRTSLPNSIISLSVPYNADVELTAYLDDYFSSTSGSWNYYFANSSTLLENSFNFRPKVANGQNTSAIGSLISLASGTYSFSIQSLTDGNTLTVTSGYFWIKVYPKF